MRWAGTEPVDVDAHEGCDCWSCCPPCVVEGCGSLDVSARLVWLGYGQEARLLMCDVHGARHSRFGVPPFAHPSGL